MEDETAAHRLGRHLKTKADQNAVGNGPEDVVALARPDGKIITVTRAKDLIERLQGRKTARTANPVCFGVCAPIDSCWAKSRRTGGRASAL